MKKITNTLLITSLLSISSCALASSTKRASFVFVNHLHSAVTVSSIADSSHAKISRLILPSDDRVVITVSSPSAHDENYGPLFFISSLTTRKGTPKYAYDLSLKVSDQGETTFWIQPSGGRSAASWRPDHRVFYLCSSSDYVRYHHDCRIAG